MWVGRLLKFFFVMLLHHFLLNFCQKIKEFLKFILRKGRVVGVLLACTILPVISNFGFRKTLKLWETKTRYSMVYHAPQYCFKIRLDLGPCKIYLKLCNRSKNNNNTRLHPKRHNSRNPIHIVTKKFFILFQ